MCKTNVATRLPKHCLCLKAIFTTWAKLHIKEPVEESQVLKESLWHNDFIQIQQQTVIWHRWRDAGIMHINDLLPDSAPRFSSHTELTEKYGVSISFLDLLQIRSAIPCSWRRMITGCIRQEIIPKPTITTTEGNTLNVLGKSSKSLYYSLVKIMKPSITSQSRWNEVFPRAEEEQQEYWESIYKVPYKAVRDTKLQAFHFRVVHRFLPCNRFLCNIRIKREDKCSFCPAVDTIEHFLFHCPLVVTFGGNSSIGLRERQTLTSTSHSGPSCLDSRTTLLMQRSSTSSFYLSSSSFTARNCFIKGPSTSLVSSGNSEPDYK